MNDSEYIFLKYAVNEYQPEAQNTWQGQVLPAVGMELWLRSYLT